MVFRGLALLMLVVWPLKILLFFSVSSLTCYILRTCSVTRDEKKKNICILSFISTHFCIIYSATGLCQSMQIICAQLVIFSAPWVVWKMCIFLFVCFLIRLFYINIFRYNPYSTYNYTYKKVTPHIYCCVFYFLKLVLSRISGHSLRH